MAKTDLIPIRVKIRHGKHPETGKTQHLYPDFNSLPAAVRDDMDWSEYIDIAGTGWMYDKVCGHYETDAESPETGVWIGCIGVPKPFADAADAAFADVEVINETTLEDFYNNRHAVKFAEVEVDDRAIAYVNELRAQGVTETDPRIAKAIDPDDQTPGLSRNKKKTWALRKQTEGLEIHASKRKALGPS